MEKIFVKLSIVLSLALLLWITLFCNVTYMENENRNASPFSLASPDGYFTDRLPFRETLMKLNRNISLLLGKNEFAGAFFGKDDYIFSNEDVSIETLKKNIAAAEEFGGVLCIVPSKTDALVSALPRFYESGRGTLWQTAAESKNYLSDAFATLRLESANGKYIYYRGDHHLTSLGSYYLYKSLASTFGFSAYGAKDFSPSVVKSDFSGSDARKMLVKTNDKIALFRYKGDGEFLTENLDTGESFKGFYNHDALNSNDPYGVFPIANAGRVRISLQGEARPKLLLICDSYGDSLAPFLARHFDLDIIDVRYYGGSVTKLKEQSAQTLFCFGMDTLASREILYKILF